MFTSLDRLTLEVKYLDPAVSFYATHLDLPVIETTPTHATLAAGETVLRLQSPSTVPRGGVHTHYAFSTPRTAYDEWYTRLSAAVDVTEHEFSSSTSLYFYDPDGHCVEIAQRDTHGEGITGIFEIVLEVEKLQEAEQFYTDLGAHVTSRGAERARVRLDLGPVDIELWEPQLGIADAQGGVHVALGLTTNYSKDELYDILTPHECTIEPNGNGVRIKDPDGHYLTMKNQIA